MLAALARLAARSGAGLGPSVALLLSTAACRPAAAAFWAEAQLASGPWWAHWQRSAAVAAGDSRPEPASGTQPEVFGGAGRRGSRSGGSASSVATCDGRSATSLSAGLDAAGLLAAEVDEEAVARLVQRSRQVPKAARALQPDQIADRVQVLLRAGLSEAEVGRVIGRHGGGPYFQADQGARNIAALLRLGMTRRQLLGCLLRRPHFLTANHAERLPLLRGLCDSDDALIHMVHQTPELLRSDASVLESSARWWRAAGIGGNWAGVKKQLRRNGVLGVAEANIREKIRLVLQELCVPEESREAVMTRKLPALADIVSLSAEGTLLPRIRFLVDTLTLGRTAGPEDVRLRILNSLEVLRFPQETVAATLKQLAGLLGEEVALSVAARCLQVFKTCTEVERNFKTLCELAGSREAAREAVSKNPALVTRNWGLAYLHQRVRYWQQQLGGATAASVLLECGTALKTRLDTVGPRVAWVKQHGGQVKPHRAITSDKVCMLKHQVPLEGFAEFKQQWLASAAGRELCRLEGSQAGRLRGKGGGSREESDSDEE